MYARFKRYFNYVRLVKWLTRCPFTAEARVRTPYRIQISGVINLRLTGSKLSIDYGVKEHRGTEYELTTGKGDSGLRFESFLISKDRSN